MKIQNFKKFIIFLESYKISAKSAVVYPVTNNSIKLSFVLKIFDVSSH